MQHYLNLFRALFTIANGHATEKISGTYNAIEPEVDVWQTPDFFTALTKDERIAADGGWALFTLDPHPYLYYKRNFDVFPLISSNSISSSEDFIEAINADPGGSPADAIGYRGEIVVVSSLYGSSVYYFDEIREETVQFLSTISKPYATLVLRESCGGNH